MKLLCVALSLMCLNACSVRQKGQFTGTWKMKTTDKGHYYLRIYSDEKVAQWPSPPDGDVNWSEIQGNELMWGGHLYQRPTLKIRNHKLLMKTSVGTDTFLRISPDLIPGQKTEQDAAANP
jgi:hypothetical protein